MFQTPEGKKVFLIGTNYWPSSSAINMWTEWDPTELAADVKRMKETGMNVCRFFLFMPDFMPTPDRIDPIMLNRLDQFLEICETHRLCTFPSFIVGHMSGEDWDLAWRNGRSLVTDPEMSGQLALYISTIVDRCKSYPHILAWVLSNELPNYVRDGSPAEIAHWTEEIIALIKSLDPQRPVSIGDGAWAPELNAEESRFHLRLLNKHQDFVGLHYYPRGLSPWHHSYTTAFRLRMAAEWKKPVLVEEFGTSTTLASEENQAHYFRSVFYSSLINNARGAISWCLNDFDFENKRPYSHHPYEERFGIVHTDKSLKPAAAEFDSFRKSTELILRDGSRKIEYNACLLIPSYYYYPYPYLFQHQRVDWHNFYLETFTLLKRANVEIRCLFESPAQIGESDEILPDDTLDPLETPLLFAPRLKVLTKQFWQKIQTYVRDGGTFYFSFANDSWIPDWYKMAGIEMDCKFGVPDFRNTPELKVKVEHDWGVFSRREQFMIPLDQSDSEYSYCPILSSAGETLMTDQYGHPILIRNRIGNGQIYFAAYPLEVLSMISQDDSWKSRIGDIYKSIYRSVFPHPEFVLDGDGLEMGVWQQTDHKYRIVVLNHSWSSTHATLYINVLPYRIESCSHPLESYDKNRICFVLGRKEACIIEVQNNL